MTFQEIQGALKRHYEFIEPEKRPEFYLKLKQLEEHAKLSRTEYAHRAQVWTEHYDKVLKESPSAQLFEAWKAWTRGKGDYNKEQLQMMTRDMQERGLPEMKSPSWNDPIIMRNMYMEAERVAGWINKKDEKRNKKQEWKE